MRPRVAKRTLPTDIRSLKSLVLFGLRGLAAYVHHANVLGYSSQNTGLFFYRALRRIGCSQADEKSLLALALEVGKFGSDALAMLDRANTETYGDPVPTSVSLTIRKGPFIVVSGHDLRDLELLLQQTEGQGVDVYTHGEMLPAHGYPKLRRYTQLKGNFGTAWQNQQREIPRLLDMGRCNDAYGAIQVALALAKELGCGVNDLPLTLVLSWYEQKAVLVLLTLLHLGIKDIRLGPTLPAFLSPSVLKMMSETYRLKPFDAATCPQS